VLTLRVSEGATGGEGGRPPFARVLVPLDGSEHAERVLPHALALPEPTGAGVLLVRVVEPVPVTLAVLALSFVGDVGSDCGRRRGDSRFDASGRDTLGGAGGTSSVPWQTTGCGGRSVEFTGQSVAERTVSAGGGAAHRHRALRGPMFSTR
jgi:hypothetical protein